MTGMLTIRNPLLRIRASDARDIHQRPAIEDMTVPSYRPLGDRIADPHFRPDGPRLAMQQERGLPANCPPTRKALSTGGPLALLLTLTPPQILASADLDQVMLQIQKLKESYESRISSLERELKENRKQKTEDARRIESLEQQLASLHPAPSALPEPNHTSDPAPKPAAKPVSPVELKTGPAPQVTGSSKTTVEAEAREMATEGPILLTRKGSHLVKQGAILLDEPNGDLPFHMRANLSMEGRYSYFGRSKDYWTPNNQPPQPVDDYSIIELNRFFLAFSGYAFDPKLNYTFMTFGSSSAGAIMPLGFVGYDWLPEIKGRVGVWKTPGTREWSDSYNATLGADRTMATTYFRPNWTPAAWLEGTLEKTFQYEFLVGNSFGGSAQNTYSNRQGTGMLYSLSGKWQPLGDIGFGISDLGWHDDFVTRLGGTATFQRVTDTPGYFGNSNPDATIVRLSNGTPANEIGALGPNSRLVSGNIFLGTLDWAFKYQGFALATEFMYRYLGDPGWSNEAGLQPGVLSTLHDYGGYLQGSYFVMPKSLEIFGRSSIVNGAYGTPWEAGGGFNWYPIAMVPNWIVTAESIFIQNSPAENLLTPYRAGASGVVGQMQVRFSF